MAVKPREATDNRCAAELSCREIRVRCQLNGEPCLLRCHNNGVRIGVMMPFKAFEILIDNQKRFAGGRGWRQMIIKIHC